MAKYKGRTVKLNKVQRGDVKKFKVFVRNTEQAEYKKLILVQREWVLVETTQLDVEVFLLDLDPSWLK